MQRLLRPAAAKSTQIGTFPMDTGLVLTALAVICLLPTTLFYLFATTASVTGFTTTSHAVGAVFACFVASFIYGLTPTHVRTALPLERWLLITLVFILLLTAHLLVASLFNQLSLGRAGSSLLGLALLSAGAFFLYGTLARSSDAALEKAASILRIAFVGMAAFSLLGLQPAGGSGEMVSEKSVFPFSEPSHFAITFAPFLVHGCLVNRGWRQLLWIGVGYALGYLLQNFSLVLGTTVAAVLCLPLSRLLLAGVVLVLVLGGLDLEYFTSRLDFSFESQNISSLVYRQGWELAGDALSRTYWWGIGFQQLGFVPFNSPTADMVYRMLFNDANIKDGGFLTAKLVAELGLFGSALVAGYVYLAAKVSWRVRRSITRGIALPPKVLFGSAVLCGFAVELFVRGLGYFTGSAILMVASVLLLANAERQSHPAAGHAPVRTRCDSLDPGGRR